MSLSFPRAITAGLCINRLLPKNSQLCSGHYPVYPKSTGGGGKYKVILRWQAISSDTEWPYLFNALYAFIKGRSLRLLVRSFIYVSRQATIAHLSSRMLLRDGEYG